MKYCTIAVIGASLLASSSVIADTSFRPRADIGVAAYDLEIFLPSSFTGGVDETFGGSSTYLKAGFGASIISGRWYFDLGFSSSLSAEADDEGFTSDFDRTDVTLTAGYVFPSNLTLFGGFKSGSSENSNYSDDPTYADEFTADGIYAGAGFSFPSGGNVFSINGAIALLDGEYSDNAGGSLDADTVGVSVGAGYNMSFTKTSGIAIKGTIQVYGFRNFEAPGLPASAFDGVIIDESIVSVDVGYYTTF